MAPPEGSGPAGLGGPRAGASTHRLGNGVFGILAAHSPQSPKPWWDPRVPAGATAVREKIGACPCSRFAVTPEIPPSTQMFLAGGPSSPAWHKGDPSLSPGTCPFPVSPSYVNKNFRDQGTPVLSVPKWTSPIHSQPSPSSKCSISPPPLLGAPLAKHRAAASSDRVTPARRSSTGLLLASYDLDLTAQLPV